MTNPNNQIKPKTKSSENQSSQNKTYHENQRDAQSETNAEKQSHNQLTNKQASVLLFSILVVALCGIAYELIISTVSSYLLGNSVFQFSLTIGFFMSAMGIGSYLSRFIKQELIAKFILIEAVVAIVGGISSLALFMAFPMVNALYNVVMYGLILIIGTLVGLEIPILTRILAERDGTRLSIANVMSLDYIGALIGSVSFPLLLLPQLGLIRSSFAIGLANVITALITAIIFKEHIKKFKTYLAFCIAVLLSLIIFTFMGTYLSSFAEHHLYFDQVVYEKQSEYQKITVTRARNNKEHRLYIDGHIQFSERDEYRYHESLVHPIMSATQGKRDNVLILGGGDGLAAREILKYTDVKLIDLVDIDPEMTKFSSEFPTLKKLNGGSLDNPKVSIHHQDAFNFINQAGIKYDRVIIDMPDPHNEALNKLYSKEFYTMIKRRMNDDALLVSQSSSPFFSRRTFWCIEETLAHVMGNTFSYHVTIPAFGVWGFNVASQQEIGHRTNQDIDSQFPIDRMADKMGFDTRYLTNDTLTAASVFGEDTKEIDSPVNSIMNPKLYQLYLDDLDE